MHGVRLPESIVAVPKDGVSSRQARVSSQQDVPSSQHDGVSCGQNGISSMESRASSLKARASSMEDGVSFKEDGMNFWISGPCASGARRVRTAQTTPTAAFQVPSVPRVTSVRAIHGRDAGTPPTARVARNRPSYGDELFTSSLRLSGTSSLPAFTSPHSTAAAACPRWASLSSLPASHR